MLAPGETMYWRQACSADWNVGELRSMLPTANENAFPDFPAMGSGKLATPWDRMHCANSNAVELGKAPDGSDDPDDPEAPDDVDAEPEVVDVGSDEADEVDVAPAVADAGSDDPGDVNVEPDAGDVGPDDVAV